MTNFGEYTNALRSGMVFFSIVKIIHIITGLNDGGAEATLFRLCQYEQTNHNSVVALMSRGKYAVKFEEIGVSVVTLRRPRGGLAVKSRLII